MIQNGADYVKKIKGIFCFKVKKGSDTGVWVVDVKNGNGSVKFDPKGGLQCCFLIDNGVLFKGVCLIMYSEMVHLIWICYYVDEIL